MGEPVVESENQLVCGQTLVLVFLLPIRRFRAVEAGESTPLDFDMELPTNIHAVHVAGFSLTGQLTYKHTRRSIKWLSDRGPNDGMGIMLGDLQWLPGKIYPVWNADHFLRSDNRNMRDIVGPVLESMTSHLYE